MIQLFSLMLLLSSCINQAEPEIHLLPQGYTGSVIITFEDSMGTSTVYEGGKRVYQVPASGILRTKFKERKKGFIADKDLLFFYVDGKEKYPLKVIHEIQNHKIDESDTNIYVFRFQNSDKMIAYLVGTLNNRSKYYQQLTNRIDSLFPPKVVQ